jgi:RimJ/RimL family protein N-acetyltransferase
VSEFPTLITDRLVLRAFTLADALEVQRLAGDRDIAATTLRIPHPYENGMAEQWIRTIQSKFENGEAIVWAITGKQDNQLMGAIGLEIHQVHESAELGYWIGKPFWGQGYCTEAARAVVHYGFEQRRLNRIKAHHFATNPASGRVMRKIGMSREGKLIQEVKKWGEFVDLEVYGIVRQR